jgi:hypothetical protein
VILKFRGKFCPCTVSTHTLPIHFQISGMEYLVETRERQSPDWRLATGQSGAWRSRAKKASRQSRDAVEKPHEDDATLFARRAGETWERPNHPQPSYFPGE